MGLVCKLFGHKLNGNTCERCGYVHIEHQWKDVEHECKQICTICSAGREKAHAYKAVTPCFQVCTVCGHREYRHQWQTEGCVKTCVVCRERQGAHQWNRVIKKQAVPHPDLNLDGCKCQVCGALNPRGEHRMKMTEENGKYVIKCTVCGYVQAIHDPEETEAARREGDVNADEGIFSR